MSQIPVPVARVAEQPGALMRLVADGLAGNGYSVSLPGFADGRRLTLTCPPARCTLTVEDCGFAVWDWRPAPGQADPQRLADLACALLTGQRGPYPRQGDGYGRPGITFKGIVGRELAARGLHVRLEIYPDENFFDVRGAIVATAPGNDAEVCVTDDGCLSWDRDYWAEAAGITRQPDGAVRRVVPGELAGGIVAAVTQALTAAVGGQGGQP